jgi:hypothetical protein
LLRASRRDELRTTVMLEDDSFFARIDLMLRTLSQKGYFNLVKASR